MRNYTFLRVTRETRELIGKIQTVDKASVNEVLQRLVEDELKLYRENGLVV